MQGGLPVVNGVTTVLEQGTARDAETNAQSIKTVGTERRVSRPSLVNFCLTGPHACSRSGLSAIAELFHTRVSRFITQQPVPPRSCWKLTHRTSFVTYATS